MKHVKSRHNHNSGSHDSVPLGPDEAIYPKTALEIPHQSHTEFWSQDTYTWKSKEPFDVINDITWINYFLSVLVTISDKYA